MPQTPEEIAINKAGNVANSLVEAARRHTNEADFRREAATILNDAVLDAGLQLDPKDEFTVASGRVDSLYNKLILEYKAPGRIKDDNNAKSNREIIDQVKEYILDVARKQKREEQRLAGVATDGFYFIFIRRVGDGWAIDEPVEVTKASTERFLLLLFSLSSGIALIPENLVNDFGPAHFRSRNAVKALYASLHSSKHPFVARLFEQWRLFFSEATDYSEWSKIIESKEEFKSFVKGMGLDPKYSEAPKVFFALHTYYALLIKLVASKAAARFTTGSTTTITQLTTKKGEQLREAFKNLESGGIFREYGIRNFLEGDFFGWYLSVWDSHIEDALSSLVHRLADYDPGTLELAPENARDLLKKLYHYLLPREIRHDLGEYYTPDWLAERLCIQTLGSDLGDARKRVLDPSCGSGTFLVILIKYIRERARKKKAVPAETLSLILKNIVGFDLNPLAVIASRTNYLLALGDLLKHRTGDIDIPVYQADSILTPSDIRYENGAITHDLFDGDNYKLRTSVGEFLVPRVFADREKMDGLANALDECVESHVSESAFLKRVAEYCKLEEEEVESVKADTAKLYKQLTDLHSQGLNGVWARIIKNSFAPLFLEPCHYIVGNPPWVNWEHLPDDYRRSTMPLWVHYGLFPKREKAMETILGAAKYDISMLMTYVSADKHLARNGKLGFVLSQSLFKSATAGQGFRRFLLPDETAFGPLIVEDMVQLKPFEGATNRTVVGIFCKGYKTKFPISYPYWKKKTSGRGSAISFDTPYEEVTSELITSRPWRAEPVNSKDPTSPWLAARPRALSALHKILGKSEYIGREGTNTGGANAVYWVEIAGKRPDGVLVISNVTERAKKKVSSIQAAIESELVYPLLRGCDVSRWNAKPIISIILTHEKGERLKAIPEKRMEEEFPKSFAYLSRFKSMLKSRPAYKRYFKSDAPFYSIFNIGDYTFSNWKVVWREQSSVLTSAVVGPIDGRPIIPDHKLMSVECSNKNEAYYLSGVLNSSCVRLAVASYAVEIQLDTHILDNICIPLFSPKNRIHLRIAALSESAHKEARKSEPSGLPAIEEQIDHAAAKLWSLSDEELAEIKRSLEEI